MLRRSEEVGLEVGFGRVSGGNRKGKILDQRNPI